jgi:hypothetical protein
VHQHALATVAAVPTRAGAGLVAVDVDEVGHHVDRRLHAEHEPRLVGEVVAHRGDRVGLVDREARRPHVGAVAADHRDVGPVQRRHEPETTAAHAARQERAHRVRDRVVDVEQVDVRLLAHLEQPRREGQVVRRVAEQRVGRDLHLVEAQPGDAAPQPARPVVAEQVHLVAAGGQCVRHLGGDDPAAADRRIAHDADAHGAR